MEIILIRHTSVDVPQGVCYGQTDVPLRDTFEQEAAITAEKILILRFLPISDIIIKLLLLYYK